MNKRNLKRVNTLAVHVANLAIINTAILGLGFGITGSPLLGVFGIVSGLVAMGAIASLVVRVPGGVSNEMTSASGF